MQEEEEDKKSMQQLFKELNKGGDIQPNSKSSVATTPSTMKQINNLDSSGTSANQSVGGPRTISVIPPSGQKESSSEESSSSSSDSSSSEESG